MTIGDPASKEPLASGFSKEAGQSCKWATGSGTTQILDDATVGLGPTTAECPVRTDNLLQNDTLMRRQLMSTISKQAQWVTESRSRPGSMTQRKESVVERWPGGVDELVREAKAQDVHLLQFTDEQGTKLIAASIHLFKVLS